ncbi:glycoside hydrolase family 18 protein [Paenibacillus sp.]|uniref:glycoside hydrolase family 18 protein n=1 Tax=Paenibacillus sp. TaxID=58172 RepID=UPI002D586438|nr:glycoside hydrolase family 18 protein [Paenibacillus sp.]HZG55354.1 glycoside hydrolase family 18 protein [Paenibacillus sp.]
MQIHVIRPGQSLWGLSQAYGVPANTIAEANQLSLGETLVVGQAVVIPIVGSYYWLQPGDSLYAVSQRFGVPAATLASVNGLSPGQTLPVGLRLYIPPTAKRSVETNAYVEPRGESVSPALETASREAAPWLTYLAPFSFQVQRDGSLDAPPLGGLPAIAAAQRVTLMMVVTNLEGGQFSAELGRIIMNDDTVQTAMLNNIVEAARRHGFQDIHFDFEFLRPEDREAYNRFLARASERLHREGFLMSTALAPKTSATQQGAWYEAHDYAAHGRYADFVVIMTYEWGYSGGPAMAVSPIGPVRRVLEYALTEMPGEKIMMGQNLYGYDWTLPYVAGGEYARALSPQAAIALARERNVAIEYDYAAQAPHFRYVDDQGRTHEVWFEDARSIQAKFDLIRELGLRGISYWKLGLPFPQNWLLLGDNFSVAKRR